MKFYHRFFMILKMIIVLLIVVNKVYETNYSHHLEEVLEDIFAVFVGVMMVFFFWPWRNNMRLDKHDKLIALSAGTLLLITKNYRKLAEEIETLVKHIIVVGRLTPLHRLSLI
mgnify:CR=1 FL=1